MELTRALIHSLLQNGVDFPGSGPVCCSGLGFPALRDPCLAVRISTAAHLLLCLDADH